MDTAETWAYIHSERAQLADTWAGLTSDQWATPSWCEAWSVQDAAGHVLAAAEQTPWNFYKEMISAGFQVQRLRRPGGQTPRGHRPRRAGSSPPGPYLITNHPPAPVMAMLGEIVAHGEDIRRPLGIKHEMPEEALVAVADNWKKSNLLIGAKRRIAGLRLCATDSDWTHGDGPEVSGPMVALVLSMSRRRGTHADLTGDGVAVLASRP